MNGFKPWYWALVGIVALLVVIGQWGDGGMVWADSQNFQGGTIPTKTPIGGVGETGEVTPEISVTLPLLTHTDVSSQAETAGVTEPANHAGGITGAGTFGWGGVLVAGLVAFAGGAWFSLRRGK